MRHGIDKKNEMKKLKVVATMLCIAVMGLASYSCSKDGTSSSGSAVSGSIVGTKWYTHFSNNKLAIIEFVSNSTCEIYFADLDYDKTQSWGIGEYSYSGNAVSFYVSLSDYGGDSYKIDNATISGTTMSSKGSKKYYYSDSWTNWDKTWNKI